MINEIYKYRSDTEITKQLLINNEFYFPTPLDFNDPFDSKIITLYEGDESDWRNHFSNSSIDKGLIEKAMVNIKENNYKVDTTIDSFLGLNRDNFLKKYIVCCFAQFKDNILMWSHYSNQHKGICLGFKTFQSSIPNEIGLLLEDNYGKEYLNQSIPSNYFPLIEIKYKYDMPIYNPLKSELNEFITSLVTKYSDWSYEKEWRIICFLRWYNTQKLKFKKEILQSVNFGLCIDKIYKSEIIDIVKENYILLDIPVKIYQAYRDRKKYKVIFEEENY